MQTLSYGVKKPETGDKGSLFFPALEGNAQLQNDHAHNGIDSAKLTSGASVALTGAIPSANWVDQGGGTYRQVITLPAGLSYDECALLFKESADSEATYLRHEKINTTSFYVYCNDSTKTLTVFYLS